MPIFFVQYDKGYIIKVTCTGGGGGGRGLIYFIHALDC